MRNDRHSSTTGINIQSKNVVVKYRPPGTTGEGFDSPVIAHDCGTSHGRTKWAACVIVSSAVISENHRRVKTFARGTRPQLVPRAKYISPQIGEQFMICELGGNRI
jgi:hypothetical protein